MAVSPTTSRYCCITIQQMLDDISGMQNSPSQKVIETNGFSKAIMREENTFGFDQVQTVSPSGKARPVTGGNRKVEIEYPVRVCETPSDTPSAFCDNKAVQGDDLAYSQVTVDEYREVSFALDENEFRQLCEEPNARLQRMIANKVNSLKNAINEELITKFIANLGNYYTPVGGIPVDSAVTPKTLLMFQADGTPYNAALAPLMSDWRRSNWSGMPILVGGDIMSRWVDTAGLYGVGDVGRDIRLAQIPTNYADYSVDTVFGDGDQHILQFVPGNVQMLNWYQFPMDSVYEKIREDYQLTTITVDGMTFDFQLRYDECTSLWNITIGKYFDLFVTPDQAFDSACGQFMNGRLQWLADCGDADCNYIKL